MLLYPFLQQQSFGLRRWIIMPLSEKLCLLKAELDKYFDFNNRSGFVVAEFSKWVINQWSKDDYVVDLPLEEAGNSNQSAGQTSPSNYAAFMPLIFERPVVKVKKLDHAKWETCFTFECLLDSVDGDSPNPGNTLRASFIMFYLNTFDLIIAASPGVSEIYKEFEKHLGEPYPEATLSNFMAIADHFDQELEFVPVLQKLNDVYGYGLDGVLLSKFIGEDAHFNEYSLDDFRKLAAL